MAELVEILNTGSQAETDLCVAELTAAGIPAIVHPANITAEFSFVYSGNLGGASLLVAEADAERARALLAELHVYDPPTAEEDRSLAADKEEQPNSAHRHGSISWVVPVIALLVLVGIILLLTTGYWDWATRNTGRWLDQFNPWHMLGHRH